ncbi:unnamed protein product [Amoebophrya sp. A25]|nr:unnamed protein product [Amoebophrya sp. A25]|eukprot:GSA25T00003245001.1
MYIAEPHLIFTNELGFYLTCTTCPVNHRAQLSPIPMKVATWRSSKLQCKTELQLQIGLLEYNYLQYVEI